MSNTKASLIWITEILTKSNIPFQITGGLAAKAYGATRNLHDIDIDIPEDKFETLRKNVNDFIIYGPSNFKDTQWDILLMTLNHHGQEIDLSGAHQGKIFNQLTGEWHTIITDFKKVTNIEILGLTCPVIPRDELLAYKRILLREVDFVDINEIEEIKS